VARCIRSARGGECGRGGGGIVSADMRLIGSVTGGGISGGGGKYITGGGRDLSSEERVTTEISGELGASIDSVGLFELRVISAGRAL
jgi:hypothetical protein